MVIRTCVALFRCILPLALVTTASAGVILNVQEVGSDIVISGGGSLDISTWTYSSTSSVPLATVSNDAVRVGLGTADLYTMPVGFSGIGVLPLGGGYTANSASGDLFGIYWVDETGGGVPTGYASGAPLSGSSTYLNRSFASMGWDVGASYTWTWNKASGGTDFLTLNVGNVPEPTSVALLMLGGVALLQRGRRACVGRGDIRH